MTKISRAMSHLRSAAQTLLEGGSTAEAPEPWLVDAYAHDEATVDPPDVDRTLASIAPATETALQREQRKSAEYFDVIVRIERERNDWIEMYRTQSSEHLTAQSMLEREIVAARQTAARALSMLNKMRKDADLELVVGCDGLLPYDGEPVGLAERYAKHMQELFAAMPAAIDGESERQAIRSAD